ncbi:unnamed protein product, partial [Nesidiocoris tenuis]
MGMPPSWHVTSAGEEAVTSAPSIDSAVTYVYSATEDNWGNLENLPILKVENDKK